MSNTKVTTGEVRFSFPHVFQPHANNPGQEEKYSVTILIPKTDTATINAIQAAMQAAAQEGVSTKFNGQMPAMLKNPMHDGDGTRPNGEPFGEECKGHMVMTARLLSYWHSPVFLLNSCLDLFSAPSRHRVGTLYPEVTGSICLVP